MADSPTHTQDTPDFIFFESIDELALWHPGTASPLHIANTPLLPRSPAKAHDSAGAGTGTASAVEPAAGADQGAQLAIKPISPLLVCHDFKGGYLSHEAAQGVQSSEMVYTCEYLQFVDVFIYFSHKCVAVPPASWINLMHKNGVRVLGTFIVEGDKGTLELQKIFQPAGDAAFFANQLVELAKTYGFDGWLLNFEAGIPEEIFDPFVLISWIQYLRDEMHRVVPGSQVIWYDALTVMNEVWWQNGITELNQPFFDVADSIFTNYGWREPELRETTSIASKLGRLKDVYSGIDVWGRGSLGGGGFNVGQALSAIQQHGLAAALFAPGWTFEHLGSQDFWENDRTFWVGKPKLSYAREVTTTFEPVASYVKMLGCGSSEFFYTNFCRGFGKTWHIRGELKSARPWVHLGLQSVLPTFSGKRDRQRIDWMDWELDEDYVYSGGWSLAISRITAELADEIAVCPLYRLGILIRKNTFLRIQYLLRTNTGQQSYAEVGVYIDIQPRGTEARMRKFLAFPGSPKDEWCEYTIPSLLDRLQVKASFQDCQIVELGAYCKRRLTEDQVAGRIDTSADPTPTGSKQIPFLYLGEIAISGCSQLPYRISSISQDVTAGGRTRLSWSITPETDLQSDKSQAGLPYSVTTGPFAYFVVYSNGELQGWSFAREYILPHAMGRHGGPAPEYFVEGIYWDGSTTSSVC